MKKYIILVILSVLYFGVNASNAIESSKADSSSGYNTHYYSIPINEPSVNNSAAVVTKSIYSDIPTKKEFFEKQKNTGEVKKNDGYNKPLYRLTDEDLKEN